MPPTPAELQFADTALRQLGNGPRALTVMLGAHNFVVDTDTSRRPRVSFRYKTRGRNGANYVALTLLPSDTYTMEFFSIRAGAAKSKGKFEDVYAEDLRGLFERETGLALGVPRVHRVGAASGRSVDARNRAAVKEAEELLADAKRAKEVGREILARELQDRAAAILASISDTRRGSGRGHAAGKKEKEVVTYTTAPVDYDWFGTHTVALVAVDNRGKTIRKVKGPASRVGDQRGRYMSGLHMAVDEAEFKKLVAYKLVQKLPTQVHGPKAGHAKGGLPYHPAAERFMILFPDGRSSFFGSKTAANKAAAAYNSRHRGLGVTVVDNAKRSPSRFNLED